MALAEVSFLASLVCFWARWQGLVFWGLAISLTIADTRASQTRIRRHDDDAEQGAAPNRHWRLGICLGVLGFHKSVCGGRWSFGECTRGMIIKSETANERE